jgi:hypothetical protein
MRILRWMPLAAFLVAGGAAFGDEAIAPKLKPDNIEVAGKLETGIMAIGGETTGTTVTTADKKTYELDLHGDKALTKAADGLNGKQVVVTGKLTVKAGVEIGERRIIRVETLAAAK